MSNMGHTGANVFPSEEDASLDFVTLDGLVVLKIMKHCQESLPSLVTGQLLGLDIGKNLEVTNCFAFPVRDEDGDGVGEEDGAEYQLEMMKCLRAVNVDNNTVGWYQSAYVGSFISESSLETQFGYQQQIPRCAMIVFDPLRSLEGVLWLKAVRLTPRFMKLYREHRFTQAALQKEGFRFSDIFEEIPIRIQNSHLVRSFLSDFDESFVVDCQFERMDVSISPLLEKNIEFMTECLEDYYSELHKFQVFQRVQLKQNTQQVAFLQKRSSENDQRRLEGLPELPEEDLSDLSMFKPISEPSRLDALCCSQQQASFCDQVTEFSGTALSKLYLLEAAQNALKNSLSLH